MRKARMFAHDAKGVIPRMSWSPHNLYNLIARSMPYYAGQASFRVTGMSMYQQRWRSKRLLRGYHGDWIRERNFKRWYLPIDLPRLENKLKVDAGREASGEERMPVASLFLREVERRLDTLVFRCCFARSAREARALIIQGKVDVNGVKVKLPGTLLNPGDLLSVQPDAVPMLSRDAQKQAEIRAAARMARAEQTVRREEGEKEGEEAAATVEGAGAEESGKGEEGASDEAPTGEAPSEGSNAEAKAETPAEASTSTSAGQGSEQSAGAGARASIKTEKATEPGVFPFHLPAFATPFLFIPPYLEVSFTTCSAIYMRHPTITPVKAARSRNMGRESASTSVLYKSDLPSPYPASGEIFSLAWEHYAKNSPRIRSDLRRMKLEAKVGRQGMQSARAKDEWKRVVAIRRGRDKEHAKPTQFVVGGALGKRRTGKASRSGRFLERGQARGRGAEVRS